MVIEWFYMDGDRRIGPLSPEQMQAHVDAGQLLPSHLVWCETMDGWAPAAGSPFFADDGTPALSDAAPATPIAAPAAAAGTIGLGLVQDDDDADAVKQPFVVGQPGTPPSASIPAVASAPSGGLDLDGYRPAGRLIAALICLFIAGIVLDFAASLLDLWGGWSFPGWNNPDAALQSGEMTFALIILGAGLLSIPVTIATIVMFCMWIFRANKNARALGALDMKFTPGWCVGWFFVPFANLVMPLLAVREIFRASDPAASFDDWKTRAVGVIVPFWWGAWIFANVMGNLTFRVGAEGSQAANEQATIVGLLSSFATLLAAGAAIMVVRAINERQELRNMRLRREAMGAPPIQMAA